MCQQDIGKQSNKYPTTVLKTKEPVKKKKQLAEKGEKNNKVSSFTSRAAHACIQF
jgi:hypothetical protein